MNKPLTYGLNHLHINSFQYQSSFNFKKQSLKDKETI